VGARFDDRVTGKVDAFAPNAEIIHIDIDPSSISKNIKVDVPIVGDCRACCGAGRGRREELSRTSGRRPRGARAVAGADREWKRDSPLRYDWATTSSSRST
jgi:acetolactate synthase-1/2/3 large subunit